MNEIEYEFDEEFKDEFEFKEELLESPKKSQSASDQATNSPIGIRPRPCRPENVAAPSCKSEPINKKKQWAPGAWQDGTRTSAFQPYKVNQHSSIINILKICELRINLLFLKFTLKYSLYCQYFKLYSCV